MVGQKKKIEHRTSSSQARSPLGNAYVWRCGAGVTEDSSSVFHILPNHMNVLKMNELHVYVPMIKKTFNNENSKKIKGA